MVMVAGAEGTSGAGEQPGGGASRHSRGGLALARNRFFSGLDWGKASLAWPRGGGDGQVGDARGRWLRVAGEERECGGGGGEDTRRGGASRR